MPKSWHKLFSRKDEAWRRLPPHAQWILSHLHDPLYVSAEGVVASPHAGEDPVSAVIRHLGVPSRQRRYVREYIVALFEHGFLVLEAGCVELFNFAERQGWRQKQALATAVTDRPVNDLSASRYGPLSVPPNEAKQSESLDPTSANSAPPSESASEGQSRTPEARGKQRARRDQSGGSEGVLDPSEKKGRVAPSARPPIAETDPPAPWDDGDRDWSAMDADEAELLALQEGVGNGRHAPPSADEPNPFDANAPPYDPDADYGDRDFLDEVCPGDAHRLTESERLKWEVNRRLETSRETAALAAEEIANG